MTESTTRKKRVSVALKVNLKYPDRETFEERFAQNISANGIFIRAKDPLPVGSEINFEYRLSDTSSIMSGVGVVRFNIRIEGRPATRAEPKRLSSV